MIIDSKLLNAALCRISPAISNNVALPILSYVLLKDKKIIATNLALTYVDELDCEMEQPLLLPYKDLLSITSATEGILDFRVHENDIKIICGKDVFEIGKVNDAALFPNVPDIDAKNDFAVDNEFFIALRNASRCVAHGNALLAFNNISIDINKEGVEIVGTDAQFFYKHVIEMNLTAEQKIVLDPMFAKATMDFNGGTISFNEKFISVNDGVTKVILTLADVKYPAYTQFFKTTPRINVTCSKKDILSALSKAMVYTVPIYGINISFGDGSVTLMLNVPEVSKSVKTQFVAQLPEDIDEVRVLGDKLKVLLELIDGEVAEMLVSNRTQPIYFFNKNRTMLLSPLVI